MTGRLDGKVALVTGAGRGIGAAIAHRFHDEGARLVVNDLREDGARAVADDLGGLAVAADVADSEAVGAMFARVAEEVGRLDILVNNAGISGWESDPERNQRRIERSLQAAEELAAGGPVETHPDVTVQTTDDDWRRMLGVHLDGTFFCCREALRIMGPQGSGAIVNMGSIMGTTGGAGSPAYSAAKAGILGLTRALARETATRGIRVNALAPGFVDTELLGPMAELKPMIALQTPMGRLGHTDDIAWAAVYLASDEAGFVTGQVLSPNGGWHMSQ